MIVIDEKSLGNFTDFLFSESAKENAVEGLSASFSHLGDTPTGAVRYLRWDDQVHGSYTYAGLALRIAEDDTCTMTLISKQNSRFYTHLRNRTAWTGPYLSVTLMDIGDVPVGDVLQLGQDNRICGQKEGRITKTFKIPGAFQMTARGIFTASGYRQWGC